MRDPKETGSKNEKGKGDKKDQQFSKTQHYTK